MKSNDSMQQERREAVFFGGRHYFVLLALVVSVAPLAGLVGGWALSLAVSGLLTLHFLRRLAPGTFHSRRLAPVKPILLFSLPLGLFLVSQTVVPFLFPEMSVPIIIDLRDTLTTFARQLDFMDGCEPALGLGISLMAIAIPVIIFDYRYSSEEKGIMQGITS